MWSLKAYLWLLAVLTLSGLALTAMYVPIAAPAAPTAPAQTGSMAGYIVRGVHFWVAQLAVLALVAHLAFALFARTNRSLLACMTATVILTGLLWFTGILLPWDDLEAWLDRGGTGLTLMRVYVLHVLLLPLLLFASVTIYLRYTRQGGANPPAAAPAPP